MQEYLLAVQIDFESQLTPTVFEYLIFGAKDEEKADEKAVEIIDSDYWDSYGNGVSCITRKDLTRVRVAELQSLKRLGIEYYDWPED